MKQRIFAFIYTGLTIALITLCFTGYNTLRAQDVLTLEQAIRIGLQNNYSIRLARNEEKIAANNNSAGNAGMLPSLQVNGSGNKSRTSSDQQFITGQTVNRTGAKATSYNANAALEWTIFDGFRMFAAKQQLNKLESLGTAAARQELENSVARIVTAYYDIVRQQQTMEVLSNAREISQERLDIAKTKQNLGSGSGLAALQAQADLNADQSAVLRQQVAITNARIELNRLLARDVQTKFRVADTIPLLPKMNLDPLSKKTAEYNSALRQANLRNKVAELNLRTLQAERFPTIGLNVGYNYSRSESESGFLLYNQSYGLTYGLTLSMNLFDGFNLDRQIQNARISAKNSMIEYNQMETQIRSSLQQSFENYQNSMQLVSLEQQNLDVAKQTVDVATERYRLGSITPLDLKEAQNTFIQAESRLVDARYQATAAETELLRISGQLDLIMP